jgi:hypothetical protein
MRNGIERLLDSLVVIDPEDPEQVVALLHALIDHANDAGISAYLRDYPLRHAAEALRSLTPEGKP